MRDKVTFLLDYKYMLLFKMENIFKHFRLMFATYSQTTNDVCFCYRYMLGILKCFDYNILFVTQQQVAKF